MSYEMLDIRTVCESMIAYYPRAHFCIVNTHTRIIYSKLCMTCFIPGRVNFFISKNFDNDAVMGIHKLFRKILSQA